MKILAVAALSRQPDLQVIGLGSGKADIAAAPGHDPIGEFQQLQNLFRIGSKLLKLGRRLRGMGELDQFHLVELVLPDQSTGILAVRTGFAPETGGIGGVTDRQVGTLEDLVAVDISHRYLGRGDEEDSGSASLKRSSSNLGSWPVAVMESRLTMKGWQHLHVPCCSVMPDA